MLLEKLVASQLLSHLNWNNLFSANQSAYETTTPTTTPTTPTTTPTTPTTPPIQQQ